MSPDPGSPAIVSPAVAAVLAQFELVAIEAGRRSAEIEGARSLPRDLVEALIDSGVFRLAVPGGLGGFDADLATLTRAVRHGAYHDGSTGWCVMSGLMAAVDAGRLPVHHATTMLSDPRSIVAGHRGPGGQARYTDDGGLVVTGRWSFGTGVAHSSWIGAGARLVEDGVTPPDGAPGHGDLHVFFRRDQVVVLDTWYALGLRGTGSTDFQVTEAFVPEGRWVVSGAGIASSGPGKRTGQGELLALGAAAVAVGLAERAIDEVVAAGRVSPDEGQAGLADRPTAQVDLARLGARLDAARGLLDRAVAAADTADAAGDVGDPEESGTEVGRQLTSASLHAVESAVAVVDRCHRLGGVGAILHASALQRILRDAHVVSQHPAVSPARWEPLGLARFQQGG